jgi:2',3'-cyclic-nucleotide 2'-phosphodiesterase (5'-nucleotidase family)
MQALPFRSIRYSEIHGDKREMRVTVALIRTLLLMTILASFAPAGLGQSKAIEPCPATPIPSPASPLRTGSTSALNNQPEINSSAASEKLIDSSISDDATIEKILAPYSGKVRELSVVIGTLEGELKKGGVGGGSLGNFIADGMKAQASAKLGRPVVLAITNSGGLRKNAIIPGQLRASDVFELLPFENALIEIELTGAQVLKLLKVVTNGRDAQAGARIQYRWNTENRPEFIGAKLIDAKGHEQEIDAAATYQVVTIDYLLKLGSGSYAILGEGKNVTPLDLTIRDAIMEYVKAETASGHPVRARLDGRFVQVGSGPAKPEASPQ